MIPDGWAGSHMGRSFTGSRLEDACPCPQEACGLVAEDRVDPDCDQHGACKTIRQGHSVADCPGVRHGG